jgi:hypothetical protein
MTTSHNLFSAADGNQTSPDKTDGDEEPFAFETAAVQENGEDDKDN